MMSNALNLAHTVHKTDDLGCCGSRRCCCDLEERESVMELKKSTCFDDDDFRPAPPSCQETQAQPRSHTTNHSQGAKSRDICAEGPRSSRSTQPIRATYVTHPVRGPTRRPRFLMAGLGGPGPTLRRASGERRKGHDSSCVVEIPESLPENARHFQRQTCLCILAIVYFFSIFRDQYTTTNTP